MRPSGHMLLSPPVNGFFGFAAEYHAQATCAYPSVKIKGAAEWLYIWDGL